MHIQQVQYLEKVKLQFPNSFKNCKVLEVGSCNVNGTIRYMFENCEYIGIDVGEGPCVDIVCSGHEYYQPDNTFDTVISSECFEHNPYWVETFRNMYRMCTVGGLVVFTCATIGRPEHGTIKSNPQDSELTINLGWGNYYKNLTDLDFKNHFNFIEMFSDHSFSMNLISSDLYFYGVKK